MRGAIPPLSQYVFMAWWLVKHSDNFTSYLFRRKGHITVGKLTCDFILFWRWTVKSYRPTIASGHPACRSAEVFVTRLRQAMFLHRDCDYVYVSSVSRHTATRLDSGITINYDRQNKPHVAVFRVATPCNDVVEHQRFGGPRCLHLQGDVHFLHSLHERIMKNVCVCVLFYLCF
jgi:hypothetical protein